MANRDEILSADFSPEFIRLMEDQVVTGFEKWGSIRNHMAKRDNSPSRVLNLVEEHLRGFKVTGKPEHLADAANHIMFLFMQFQLRPESVKME